VVLKRHLPSRDPGPAAVAYYPGRPTLMRKEGPRLAMRGKDLLAVWTDILTPLGADFDRWYDEEHLAVRTGIPGFLTARRSAALQSMPKYVALYDTVDAQVL
jgi:hypothetical protein